MKTRNPKVAGGCLIAFGTVFGSFGLLVGWAFVEGSRDQNRAATEFLPVQAEVLSSKVEVRTSGNEKTTRTSYSPKIRYRYGVDGKTYESDRYAYVYASGEDVIRAAVEARPAGSTTTAYYDPEDPSVAVLIRTPASTTIAYVILTVFFLAGVGVVGLGMWMLVRPMISASAGVGRASIS